MKILQVLLGITLAFLFASLGFFEGVKSGKTTLKIEVDKAYKQVDEANKRFTETVESLKQANGIITKIAGQYNDCVAISNAMVDLIWDTDPKLLEQALAGVPKPDYLITLDIPLPLKLDEVPTYPNPVF